MRYALFVDWRCLAVFCVLFSARSLDAATIEGRVVDSTGEPVAGAEVRVWQKLPAPNGNGISDQQTTFNGRDVVLTDENGRYVTPDAVVEEAFARVVVEADGMLAGRSGWIEIRKDAQAKAPDITLKRLRIVIGQVLGRRGEPVDGATVFNSGDGHKRIETTSKGRGKFRLADVPDGGVFLFAEAPGYRLTGVRLRADETQATLTLTSVDEPAEPLATLPPLLSDERQTALAREILDPWLAKAEESAAGGFSALLALAELDPVEAFNRADQMQIKSARERRFLELAILTNCLKRRDLSLDELRPLIESAEDPSWRSRAYIEAVRRMDNSNELRRREWLALGLLHARRIDDAAQRAQSLVIAAAGLSGAGDDQRAGEVISEAEGLAEQLPMWDQESQRTFRMLALNLAKRDPVRALAWLERIEQDYFYINSGGDLAVELLPEHPAAAEDAWNRTAKRLGDDWGKCHMGERGIQLAEFCYRLAGIDRLRAVQVARNTQVQPLRVRGLGAVALRLADSDPASARQLLESLLRDELPHTAVDDELDPFGFSYLAPPFTAAWLLPIAERIDPQLGRECFWRALALRAPRPRRGPFSDRDAEIDTSLTMMLSRYDRNIARALLEPLVARLPEYRPGATSNLKAQHAIVVAMNCRSLERMIVSAAAHVDPRWAVKIFKTFPPDERFGSFNVAAAVVNTLSKQGANRWGEDGFFDAFSANYWQPKLEPASHASAESDGEPAGVGLALAESEGRVVVGKVLPDGAAATSGAIHEGDRIMAVGQKDDAPVATKGRGIGEVVAMIRGKKGSIVRLTIVPAEKRDDQARMVTLVRGNVKALNLFGAGEAIKIGSRPPPLAFARIGDDTKQNVDSYKGRIVVLAFWASWCGPCKKAVDNLLALPAEKVAWRDRVVVLALSVDDSKDAASTVRAERRWDEALVGWCGPAALKAYDVNCLPATFVLDVDGKVAALGDVDVDDAVNKLLKE